MKVTASSAVCYDRPELPSDKDAWMADTAKSKDCPRWLTKVAGSHSQNNGVNGGNHPDGRDWWFIFTSSVMDHGQDNRNRLWITEVTITRTSDLFGIFSMESDP